jgi:hypothetical protein
MPPQQHPLAGAWLAHGSGAEQAYDLEPDKLLAVN